MIQRLLIVALLALALSSEAEARSRAPVRAFIAENPCPINGETVKRCPGYVVDHIWPLCAGGLDAPENMQWQAIGESRRKDRAEVDMCRWLRKAGKR